MSAAQYNFTIEQGVTYRKHLVYSDPDNIPIDLTGWSARMQIRTKVSDATPLITITDDVLTSDADTIILLGGATGTIDIYMSDGVTSNFSFKKAVYDLEVVNVTGDVTRLLEGKIELNLEVTRT